MAANYRTDRSLPFPEVSEPVEGLDVSTLVPGDRVKVVKPLRDLKTVKAGTKGTVIRTDGNYRPVLQLEDGTVVNIIDADTLAAAPAKSTRGVLSLLTLRHDTDGWKPGFGDDVYLRIPAAGNLEGPLRSIVDQHNSALLVRRPVKETP